MATERERVDGEAKHLLLDDLACGPSARAQRSRCASAPSSNTCLETLVPREKLSHAESIL
jgi:hypothetical protein